jgi:predicted TIM-barrel fold metal-dependent hydrolase
MLVRSSPDRMLKVRENFPGLKIVAAHFGGFQLWDEVKKYLVGKDIYLDTAFFFDYLAKDEIEKLLLAHRPDRLLFGSDFPLTDPGKDIEFIRTLDIPQGLKEKILYTNAKTLLGL